MGYKIHLCDEFSSVDFIYLIPLFTRIVWIDKVRDLMKTFFPNKDVVVVVVILSLFSVITI